MFSRITDRDAVNMQPLSVDDGYVIGIGRDGIEPVLDIISPLISKRHFFATTTASSCTALYRRDLIERHGIRFHSERELMSEDYIFSIDFGMVCRKSSTLHMSSIIIDIILLRSLLSLASTDLTGQSISQRFLPVK